MKDPTAVRAALAITMEGLLMGRFLLFPLPGEADWQSQERKSNAFDALQQKLHGAPFITFCTCVAATHKEIVSGALLRILLKNTIKTGRWVRGDPDGEA
ncbi:hypothetical protein [Sinorhizobium fredii]